MAIKAARAGPRGSPLTQAAIAPGQNQTYRFRAWPAGTHYWHSHMDAMQSAKGLRGAFIVRKREEGPQMPKYDEEKVLVLADEWRDPDVCLKLEGAVAGNDVCSDIDFGSLNGQVAWGNLQKFDKRYPYPLVEVEQGKCYRMRMIMMASNGGARAVVLPLTFIAAVVSCTHAPCGTFDHGSTRRNIGRLVLCWIDAHFNDERLNGKVSSRSTH